jgi:putative transcriptional regulator
MDNKVTAMKPYGHIELTLKELMQQKNISRGALARAINARYEVIDKWYDGRVERMDMDVLARICYVLECRPEDIIIYKK